MRLLLDECVDPRVKTLFPQHEVSTVHEMGWDELTDSELLALAQKSFNALLTIDKSLEFQQNLGKLRLGVIVVRVRKNQMAYYRAIQQDLSAAMERIVPGQIIHVPKLPS
jgi:predicted nuclease of predicted toxin-antitoxin system